MTMRSPYVLMVLMSIPAINQAAIIMLDPAGHAKYSGRTLHQSYERAETYKFACALQQRLKSSSMHVMISRAPGEGMIPLQTASLVNRLNVDLFLRIHLCKYHGDKPKLFIYQLVYDTIVDFAKRTPQAIAFTPIHQAHFFNIHQSRRFGKMLLHHADKDPHRNLFELSPLFEIPIKPLVGIIAPAVALEIGLPHNDQQWELFVEPVAHSIQALIQESKGEHDDPTL